MPFFKTILKSSQGMSMAEMAVTVGLMGIGVLGLLNLSDMMTGAAGKADAKVAKMQFTSALNGYIYSDLGCEDLKIASSGGSRYSLDPDAPSPIRLTKWKYQGLDVIEGGFNPNNRPKTPFFSFAVSAFYGYLDPISNAPSVKARGPDGLETEAKKTILNVVAELKEDKNVIKAVYTVPVLVSDEGNLLYCSDKKTLAETCAAMKGIYNPFSGKCDLEDACDLMDTYTQVECSPASVRDDDGVTLGCSRALGGEKLNQFTTINGGLACPDEPGVVDVLTDSSTFYVRIKTGKKSHVNQRNSYYWHSCIRCPCPGDKVRSATGQCCDQLADGSLNSCCTQQPNGSCT